jgi:hypothetical protein
MTPERWLELERDQNSRVTHGEIADGWHFCPEWDGLLIGPEMGEFQCCLCDMWRLWLASAEHGVRFTRESAKMNRVLRGPRE